MFENQPSLQLFSDLLVAAPSGREANLAAIVRQKLTALDIVPEQDGMGNVIVRLNGRSPQSPLIMYAAQLLPAQLKAAGVRPGSTAVPTRERRGPVLFGDPADPLVAAWTFDDRMGVVALLRLLAQVKEEGIRTFNPPFLAPSKSSKH
ncbi:MAG: hypothetical protein GY796_34050 [Chloroflexi bacterium]|nr:hypothetical protein [Chloroflexota bacterium]